MPTTTSPRKVILKSVENEAQKQALLKSILKEGGARAGDETILLLTPEEFSKVFTPERVKLLKLLKDRPDLSVNEISKNLRRRREAVSRDLRFFEGLSLIKLERHARLRVPKQVVQEISIRL